MTVPRYTAAAAVSTFVAALAGVGAIAHTAGPNPHLPRSFGFDLAVLASTYLLVLAVALLVYVARDAAVAERMIEPPKVKLREFEYRKAS